MLESVVQHCLQNFKLYYLYVGSSRHNNAVHSSNNKYLGNSRGDNKNSIRNLQLGTNITLEGNHTSP